MIDSLLLCNRSELENVIENAPAPNDVLQGRHLGGGHFLSLIFGKKSLFEKNGYKSKFSGIFTLIF